jgi:hypothetical protein
MVNRNQVFLIIIAAISIISAWILKDIDYYSSVILLIVTAVVFFLIFFVYRTKKKPLPPPEHEESKLEILPPPNANQSPQHYDLLPFDQKIGRLIDKCIDEATTTAKLNIKVQLPLPPEIDYRGEKVKIEGNLTVEMNSTTTLTKTATAPAQNQLGYSEKSAEQ